jgi:hypothetical protein
MIDLTHITEEMGRSSLGPGTPALTCMKTQVQTFTHSGTPEWLINPRNTPTQANQYDPSLYNTHTQQSPPPWLMANYPSQPPMPYGVQQHQPLPPQRRASAGTPNDGPRSAPPRQGGRPTPSQRANPTPQAPPTSPRLCKYCGEVSEHWMRDCPLRPVCTYCHKRGHIQRNCYLANGICGRCKQPGHTIAECQNSNPQGTPTCPFCRGAHWGKDCETEKN